MGGAGGFPWWWWWQERRCVPTDWSRAACVLLIPRDRLFAAVGWSTPASAIGWSTQSASVGCTHTQRASLHPHVDVVITAHYTVVTTGVGGKSRRTGEERDACNRNDDANPHSTNLQQGITGTHTHTHTHNRSCARSQAGCSRSMPGPAGKARALSRAGCSTPQGRYRMSNDSLSAAAPRTSSSRLAYAPWLLSSAQQRNGVMATSAWVDALSGVTPPSREGAANARLQYPCLAAFTPLR